MSTDLPTPKVFISYAWTDEEHQNAVVKLAERLVNDGIDVVLDVWDFKEGNDKFAFMERMVSDPTVIKVLAICDRKYSEKADGRAGGVGTESQIISPEVYKKTDQEKFIPILWERNDDGEECVPVFFKGKKYFDFSSEDNVGQSYEALVRSLYGKPERVKPAIGRPPAHLMVESAPNVRPTAKLDRLRSALDRGKPHTHTMLQEYLDVFLEEMEGFRLKAHAHSPDFDEAVVKNIAGFVPWRDNFLDAITLVAGYMNDSTSHDSLIGSLEELASYVHRKETTNSWNELDFDNYRFILFELFLSTIALLIRNRHYKLATMLMSHNYSVAQSVGGTEYRVEGLRPFNSPISSIDDNRNQRLKLNKVSLVSELLKERATYPKVRFGDLIQADFIMFVRYCMGGQNGHSWWYPRTAIFFRRPGGSEIFARATSDTGFKAIKELFGVSSKEEFAKKLQAMLESKMWHDFSHSRDFWCSSFLDVLNAEAILRAGGIAERSN